MKRPPEDWIKKLSLRDKIIIRLGSKTNLFGSRKDGLRRRVMGILGGVKMDLAYTPFGYIVGLIQRYLSNLPPQLRGMSDPVLSSATVECGYYNFLPLFPKLNRVMKNLEAQILFITTFLNVSGGGIFVVKELIPGKKLVVQSPNNYEAVTYLEKFGRSDKCECYGMRGAVSSIMDLAYGEKPPKGLYTFLAEETKCVAKGDEYCEFVATLPPPKE